MKILKFIKNKKSILLTSTFLTLAPGISNQQALAFYPSAPDLEPTMTQPSSKKTVNAQKFSILDWMSAFKVTPEEDQLINGVLSTMIINFNEEDAGIGQDFVNLTFVPPSKTFLKAL